MTTVRVVDVETTGTDPTIAEVIELGWQDVSCAPDARVASLTGPTLSRLYGSERPCPPEVLAVHHILDEERAGLPRFLRAPGEAELFRCTLPEDTTALAAHNAAFEQSFLHDGPASPGTWLGLPFVCTYKCALHLWPDMASHSNQALRYALRLSVDADRAHPPHRAGPDAYVTAALLQRMLEVTNLEQLLEWSGQPTPMPVFRFGKHKGQKIGLVDRDYLEWVVNKSDLEADVKHACRQELRRRAELRRQTMEDPYGNRQMGLELTGHASAVSLDQDP